MKFRLIDRDLLIVGAITIIAVALAFALPPDWVPGRILIAPLVLLLPGYALISALLPSRELGFSERFLFSLALSVATVILGGLALNWTPSGLHAGSWTVYLGTITLVAWAVAFVRRRRQATSASGSPSAMHIGFTLRQGLLLGLAALIVCGAVAFSIVGAERQPYPGFTQLWILPAGGASPKNTVSLGVSNMETTTMEYQLTVNVDGKVIKEWSAIDLNPNEKWEASLFIPQSEPPGATEVVANLYTADSPTRVYRQVVLWLGT